ncbi:MAG: hypothetical protein EZS28_021558 [Streblomastix strix]|uniref:Uncharacterized protein n=1 Tax=Streblomastix strix TaxID=222440 RepID=A0A5J4VL21_9EUKA|nr:MAG: hypothetical protein EZS28_021558 [Streblomastix strix]
MPKKSWTKMEAQICQWLPNNKQWPQLGIQFLLFLLQKYQKDKTEKQTYITEAIKQIQKGDYEYFLLAKRLYKKELAAVITQLYQADDIDARIKEALGQAMGKSHKDDARLRLCLRLCFRQ